MDDDNEPNFLAGPPSFCGCLLGFDRSGGRSHLLEDGGMALFSATGFGIGDLLSLGLRHTCESTTVAVVFVGTCCAWLGMDGCIDFALLLRVLLSRGLGDVRVSS